MKVLKIIYYISTFIIAVVAITGIIYTISSNRETSETLKSINNTFETYTEPILVFDKYRLFNNKDEKLSCDNLPWGINFSYKNASNFPIKFKEDSILVKYGKLDLLDSKGKSDSTSIAPNSTDAFTMIDRNFPSIFLKKKFIYDPPLLEITLYGIISNLSETKKYKIVLVTYIINDCQSFDAQNIINHSITYERIQ